MSRARRGPRRPLPAVIVAILLCLIGGGVRGDGSVAGPTPFRVAFTSAMFTDVNEDDARASVKAWAATIAKERGIDVAPDPQVLAGVAELARACAEKTIDAAGMTVADFLTTGGEAAWSPIFGASIGDRLPDEYCLLVPRDRELRGIGDLKGTTLLLHQNSRVSLAEAWLDELLRTESLPEPREFFGRITPVPKLSQVILPVFFHQADACVVTRRGFETLVELNPQVGRDLRILAVSPELIATVFCFRADFGSPSREELIAGLTDLHRSAAGRQVLTIFQSDRLQQIAPTALDTARRLTDSSRTSRPENRAPRATAARPNSRRTERSPS